jgi:hypothetical protein
MNTVLMISTTIIAIGGAVAVIWKLLKPLIKKTKSLMEALDLFTRDWFGETETPGRARVPGVMERLNRIDGELKHNGGSSMKDSLKRIETKIAQIDDRLEDGNSAFLENEGRLNRLESDIELLKKEAQ